MLGLRVRVTEQFPPVACVYVSRPKNSSPNWGTLTPEHPGYSVTLLVSVALVGFSVGGVGVVQLIVCVMLRAQTDVESACERHLLHSRRLRGGHPWHHVGLQ